MLFCTSRLRAAGAGGPQAIGVLLLLLLLLLLIDVRSGAAFEQAEFSQLLQMMPPDGLPERYGNVMFEKSGRQSMPPALFPHWLHRAKYTCNVCHLDLGFSMHRGKTGISRADYLAGRYCGACHDGKTAFSVKSAAGKHCDRCHVNDESALDARFREFAGEMPKSGYGNKIDWVAALEKGLIKPKRSFYEEEPLLDLPGNLKKPLTLRASSARSTTPFPHTKHVGWMDCSGCHPEIFNIKKAGTDFFSMSKNLFGWFCGSCHLRVSFSMQDCGRCHPHIKSGSTGPRF
jgi:c(7)-type cytochrome triheme protein